MSTTRNGRRVTLVLALMAAAAALPSTAVAQRGPARPLQPQVTSAAELQRMFDADALIQAQEQLQIDDSHYAQFLTRFKALQEIRQQAVIERTRRLQELRQLADADPVDEDAIKDRLGQLDALQARTDRSVRDAYTKIDEVLDVRQQAKFRIFEEEMERRKVDLLMRARQANRRQQPQEQPTPR